MYALDGHMDLREAELDHLCGYRDSKPVRIGNGAFGQMQLDTYGELMDARPSLVFVTQSLLIVVWPVPSLSSC